MSVHQFSPGDHALLFGRSEVVILEAIPGVGTVAGGTVNATIASGFTAAMGAAWTAVCMQLAQGKLAAVSGAMDHQAVRRLFLDEFTRQISKLKLRSK